MKALVNEDTSPNPSNGGEKFSWDEVEVNVEETKPESLLDDLSEYKSLNADTVPPPTSPNPSYEEGDRQPDINDPRFYYVRGKKKGQRKPDNGNINVSYKNPTDTKVLTGSIISGALFLTMIDLVMPLAIAGVNNYVSKVKIDPEMMKLTDKQKKELEPLFDAIVKSINFEGNPVLLGVVGLGSIYAMTYFMARNTAIVEAKMKDANS